MVGKGGGKTWHWQRNPKRVEGPPGRRSAIGQSLRHGASAGIQGYSKDSSRVAGRASAARQCQQLKIKVQLNIQIYLRGGGGVGGGEGKREREREKEREGKGRGWRGVVENQGHRIKSSESSRRKEPGKERGKDGKCGIPRMPSHNLWRETAPPPSFSPIQPVSSKKREAWREGGGRGEKRGRRKKERETGGGREGGREGVK